jgi:hypothetical protein
MNNEDEFDEKALAAEMQGKVQLLILEWFANLLRVRLAGQSAAQRALSIAILQDGLQEVLTKHETQNYASPVSRHNAAKALHFKQAFGSLSEQLMRTMGSGLNEQEMAALL